MRRAGAELDPGSFVALKLFDELNALPLVVPIRVKRRVIVLDLLLSSFARFLSSWAVGQSRSSRNHQQHGQHGRHRQQQNHALEHALPPLFAR